MSDLDARPELAGKRAVLTGATRGIGLAVAHAFVAAGALVIVNGREAAAVEQAVEELTEAGGIALGVIGSAADPDVVEELAAYAASSFGGVDVVVNCAGTAEPPGSSILDIAVEDWHGLLDAHLTSAFLTSRAFAPAMVARGSGVIINTGSHAWTGRYGGTGYAAGKGGVVSLTYALAAELREHGVRVNAICPGARTRLSTGADYEASIVRLHDRGLIDDAIRDGSLAPAGPEHVAPLYVYLASDRSAPITGRVLVGAGGYLGWFDPPRERFLDWRESEGNPPWSVAEIDARIRGHLAPEAD